MIDQIFKFNLFQANVPFLSQLKISENLIFSGGMEKEQLLEMGYESVFN